MEQSKYSEGKIYRIQCNITGLVYIGSTINTLASRLSGHKSGYKRYLKQQGRFVTSYKILEKDDYDIILIEKYPCESKKELIDREGECIRGFLDSECVNKNIPGKYRTMKQYREENNDKINIQRREYRRKKRMNQI
jgi:hypothetical protein